LGAFLRGFGARLVRRGGGRQPTLFLGATVGLSLARLSLKRLSLPLLTRLGVPLLALLGSLFRFSCQIPLTVSLR
jgi:hypothetical protein